MISNKLRKNIFEDRLKRAWPMGIRVEDNPEPDTDDLTRNLAKELVSEGRASWTSPERRAIRLNMWHMRMAGT